MLEHQFLGNSVMEWLWALSFPIIGIIISVIVMGVLGTLFKTKKTLHSFILSVGKPLNLLGFFIGLRFGLGLLKLSAEIVTILTNGIGFMIILSLTWALARFYESVHQNTIKPYVSREDTGLDLTILNIIGMLARSLIWILGIGSALNNAGFDVSAVLAGLGLGGLAIAMASKDTVSNFFGGVLVLISRPFGIGDRIEIAGQVGWVQEIGLRVTRLTNWYGRNVYLPNKVFTESTLINIDAQKSYYIELRLCLAYGTNSAKVQKAQDILREIVEECSFVSNNMWLGLAAIKNGLPEVELWYSVDKWTGKGDDFPGEYDKILAAKHFINMAVLERYEKEGISIALPTEVRIASDKGPPSIAPPMVNR